MKPYIGLIIAVVLTADLAQEIGGNAKEGDKAPAIVTAVWSDTSVNARIIGDGTGGAWVTSCQKGDGPREWSYPDTGLETVTATLAPGTFTPEGEPLMGSVNILGMLGVSPLSLLMPILSVLYNQFKGQGEDAIRRGLVIPDSALTFFLSHVGITDAAKQADVKNAVAALEKTLQDTLIGIGEAAISSHL